MKLIRAIKEIRNMIGFASFFIRSIPLTIIPLLYIPALVVVWVVSVVIVLLSSFWFLTPKIIRERIERICKEAGIISED